MYEFELNTYDRISSCYPPPMFPYSEAQFAFLTFTEAFC